MTTCPQCGAENYPGMAYCEQCGAPLTAPESVPAPAQGGDPGAAEAIAQAVLDQVGGDADQAAAQDSQDGEQAPSAPQAADASQDAAADEGAAAPPDDAAQAIPPDAAQPAMPDAPTGTSGSAQPVEAALSLTITFGDGAHFTVQNEVTNVGRSDVAQNWHPELDVIPFGGGAPDLGVSRHQAVIQRNSAGFSIYDVGSTNGTFVNGRALEYNKPADLHDGDTLAFGAFNAKVSIK